MQFNVSVTCLNGKVKSRENDLIEPTCGYEAGAEDAGSGELLAEAHALQYAFYDLDESAHKPASSW
ncbi:MAG: hypothetical protein WCJ35_26700 [Planctomycetota bacterium]